MVGIETVFRELEQGKESCHIGKALTVVSRLGMNVQINGDTLMDALIAQRSHNTYVQLHVRLLSLMVLMVLCFFNQSSFAEVGRPLHASQPLVVGGDRDYPPYEFINTDGKPDGFNVELTRAIADVMGMDVTFQLGGWSEMRNALQTGAVDLLQGMSQSEAREKEVDFSLPHAMVNHAIFGRRDSPQINSFDQMNGKSVAVHNGGIMHDYLREKRFNGELYLTQTPADALRMVAAGKADYAIVAIVPGTYLIRELKLTNLMPMVRNVATQRYGYAVKKGNLTLLSQMNEGLAILRKTGRYNQIYNKWLGVLEPEHIHWRTFFKYGAVVVVPLVLLLGGFALWSRTLHRQVLVRTADLTREVTERKHAEEELRLNQQQLVQADKMAALGVLVSGVAHEINNPTGLILLDLPILKRAYRDSMTILEERYSNEGDFMLGGVPYTEMRSEIPRILNEMQEGAQRIKRIVHDLKDFARKDDAGDKTEIALNDVVRTSLRLVESTIRRSTNHCNSDLAENLPSVLGNAQRIEQIIVNLMLNACQALHGVEESIFVTTRYNQTTGNVILAIRDEGMGISEEHLPRLMDPFFTTKRNSGGTGLGLSVSAGIIKEHGGNLAFTSTLGKGTTVTLTLPAIDKECTA